MSDPSVKEKTSNNKEENFYKDVFDSISEGLFVLDSSLKILFANKAVSIFFPDSDLCPGEKCYKAIKGLNKPCMNCPAVEVLQTCKPAYGTTPLRSGSEIDAQPLKIKAYPFQKNDNGEPSGVVVQFHGAKEATILDEADYGTVSQSLQQTEEALLDANEKVESLQVLLNETNSCLCVANQDLEKYTFITSHDLKTPLRAIGILAKWLAEDIGDKLSSEQRRHMNLLVGRVHRMERMLDDILQYFLAGRYASRFDIQPEIVDTRILLNEVISDVNPPENVSIDLSPQMPVFETCREPLKKVFYNLIENTVKHGGSKLSKVVIKAEDNEDYFFFEVTDDGTGFSDEYNSLVFEVFKTLKPRDEVEGSGVGLAIVKKIVENAGGKIQMASQQGEGCSFKIKWPKYWEGVKTACPR